MSLADKPALKDHLSPEAIIRLAHNAPSGLVTSKAFKASGADPTDLKDLRISLICTMASGSLDEAKLLGQANLFYNSRGQDRTEDIRDEYIAVFAEHGVNSKIASKQFDDDFETLQNTMSRLITHPECLKKAIEAEAERVEEKKTRITPRKLETTRLVLEKIAKNAPDQNTQRTIEDALKIIEQQIDIQATRPPR